MILKELHPTDALRRISIFPPLTYNGEVRILTWPQVIDISKIRDIQIVGTSGLIKFWKLEKILLRTVAVARAYTFLEVRSRDSTWWPDLMWPRHKNFTTDVKLINEKVCRVWLRCSFSFSSYPRKTTGGGGAKWPPPTRAKVKENFKALFYHSLTELKWNTLILKAGPLPGYMKVTWLSKISWRTAEAGPHHPRPYFAAVQNVSRSWQWFCSKMPLTLTSRFMETWLVEVINSIVAVVYVFVYSVVKCVWGAADNMS